MEDELSAVFLQARTFAQPFECRCQQSIRGSSEPFKSSLYGRAQSRPEFASGWISGTHCVRAELYLRSLLRSVQANRWTCRSTFTTEGDGARSHLGLGGRFG